MMNRKFTGEGALALVGLFTSLVGCSKDEVVIASDGGTDAEVVDGAMLDATADASLTDASTATFLAHCNYRNTFSMASECREYAGAWTMEAAAADCARVFPGATGELAAGACALESALGRCVVGDLAAQGYATVTAGQAGACGATQNGCETFARGTFEPSSICDASGCIADGVARPAARFLDGPNCQLAREGEPAGRTNGQVCTPVTVSASTEEGRFYPNYADCDIVRSQRPYYPTEPVAMAPENDARLADASYMAEVAWLKEQAEASACTCCHTRSVTPRGASTWDTEAGLLWVDSISNEALAMFAGFTDSAAFGFMPVAENNGFDRSRTGLPTTDEARLIAFMTRELNRRGVSVEQARALEPFGPFFQELIDYRPEACPPGVGIGADGQIRWQGGGARYISVLRPDSASPGAPPNWNLPEGTLWSIAVPAERAPLSCEGIRFGQAPEGTRQRIPVESAPAPLVSGQTYYLYVESEVVQPITRCLFVAP